jgi:hypothetical protein
LLGIQRALTSSLRQSATSTTATKKHFVNNIVLRLSAQPQKKGKVYGMNRVTISHQRFGLGLLVCLCLSGLFSGCGVAEWVVNRQISNLFPDLWADVPAIAGSEKANKLPLESRLTYSYIAKFGGTSEGTCYLTKLSPAEVTRFYAYDKMKAFGWNQGQENDEALKAFSELAQDDPAQPNHGALISHTKRNGDQEENLIVYAIKMSNLEETLVIYTRLPGKGYGPAKTAKKP